MNPVKFLLFGVRLNRNLVLNIRIFNVTNGFIKKIATGVKLQTVSRGPLMVDHDENLLVLNTCRIFPDSHLKEEQINR